MDSVERVIMQEWKARAKSLRTTRDVYIKNIKVTAKSPTRIRLELHGMVPNIVEQGMGPGGVGTFGTYDIRKFMKFGDKGYVNVRFRKPISGMSGSNTTLAKSLAVSRSKPGDKEGFIYGKKTAKNIGPRFPAGKVPVRKNPTTGKSHATDYMADMIRTRGAGASAASGTSYSTFRRISKTGKPWMSKGVRPRKFAADVVRALPRLIGPTIEHVIRAMASRNRG